MKKTQKEHLDSICRQAKPEGYYVAFANLYAMFTKTLERKKAGEQVDENAAGYPTLDDGIEGVIFVEKCLESMRSGNIWTVM